MGKEETDDRGSDKKTINTLINDFLKTMQKEHCETLVLGHVYTEENEPPSSGFMGMLGPWPLESLLMALKKLIERADMDPVHVGTMLIALGAKEQDECQRLDSLLEDVEN